MKPNKQRQGNSDYAAWFGALRYRSAHPTHLFRGFLSNKRWVSLALNPTYSNLFETKETEP
jgi:hypothetical protein